MKKKPFALRPADRKTVVELLPKGGVKAIEFVWRLPYCTLGLLQCKTLVDLVSAEEKAKKFAKIH
jgi:hypothetical protein